MAHADQQLIAASSRSPQPEHSRSTADAQSGNDPRLLRLMHRFAFVCGCICAALAALGLVSWTTGIVVFRTWVISNSSEMKPNTGLALLTAGLGLCISQTCLRKASCVWLCRGLAAISGSLGALTLLEYVLARDLRIDNVLFRLFGSLHNAGRMAPHTALAVLFAGLTLILMTFSSRSLRWIGQAAAALTGFFSLLALLSYAFDITPLYKLGKASFMAFPTSIALGCLCLGSLFATAEAGLFAPIVSRGGGGLMLRRVLPIAMLAPCILAWLVSRGTKLDFYRGDTGVVILALAIMLIFFWLLYGNARALNRLDLENERSREMFRQSSEQWKLTFNCMSEGLSYHDPDYNVVGANTAFQNLLSKDCSEREKCYRLVHGTDAPPESCPMRKTLETGQTSQSEIYEPRLNKYLQVRTDPVRDASGNIFRIVHVVEDITERKIAEEHIRRLAAIVESSQDAIYSADVEGNIQSWNHGAELMYGYSAEEIAGNTPERLYIPEMRAGWRPLHDAVVAGERIDVQEMPRLRKDGSQFYVSLSVSPVRDSSGNVTGTSVIARDMTERKRAEAEIQMLNAELEDRVRQRTAELEVANKELEAFSYSVSHDLRAPLRSLDGFSHILLDEFGDKFDGEGRDFLNRLRAASQQMGQLIDALLQLSRVSRSEMTKVPVDLSEMARHIAAELTASAPHRRVQFDISDGMNANGDPRLLHAALQNLLGNAWKFTSKCEQASIIVGCVSQNGRLVFFVRDNGAGFEMDYVNKLFKAFQRLHTGSEFEGSGIGLATVQRIIKRHGGSVWAEGKPNAGATFYFTLS